MYEDLYQCYQEEHGLNQLYVYVPMRLGELQVDSKKKSQLLYLIGQMLRAESMTYPTPYPLSNEQELFINKCEFRQYFKYDLITKMPDGEEKDKEAKKFWWSVETDCFTIVLGHEMRGYLERMSMDSYPDQVVNKKEEAVLAVKKKKRNPRKRKKRI